MEEQPMGAGGNAGASRIWKEMHWKEITLYLTVKGACESGRELR